MYQHQLDAEAGKQIEILHQLNKFSVLNDFTPESDDEDFSMAGMDMGGDGTKPGDKFGIRFHG